MLSITLFIDIRRTEVMWFSWDHHVFKMAIKRQLNDYDDKILTEFL